MLCKCTRAEYLKPFSLFSKSALCAKYTRHFIVASAPSLLKANLNCCQACWSIFLADFDFEIQYRPGAQQGKVDALFRCSKYELREGDEAYGQQTQTSVKPKRFRVIAIVSTFPDSYLVKDIKMATKENTWATNIKKELQERPRNPNHDNLDQFEQQDGLLF